MKLSCRFGWHNWGKWSNEYARWYEVIAGGDLYFNIHRDQKCQDCNHVRTKKYRSFLTGESRLPRHPIWEDEND